MQDAAVVQRDETEIPSRDTKTSRAKSLANLRPQQKGEPSRNPRGRPKKDLDLAREAQKHALLAIKTLADICADEEAPPSSRVSAAGEILDRGYGRAPQSIKMTGEVSFGEQFEDFIRSINARTIEHGNRLAREDSAVVDIVPAVCEGSARGDA